MDKEQLVSKLANRLDAKPAVVEAAIDATLAEMLAPVIFAPPELRRGVFDNNCNNNCLSEVAIRTPSRQ